MSKVKKRSKRLTLRALIDADEEIWVINRGKTPGDESGKVVFQIGSGAFVDSVVIPPGQDPICITDMVDPESLKSCRDLFKLVRGGTLELLDPSDADTYYEQHQERKAIVEEKIKKLMEAPLQPDQKTRIKQTSATLHPKVGDVCRRLAHANITERDAIEKLLEQKASLSEDDYQYLIQNGVHDSVKNWAQDQYKQVMANK